MKSLKLKDEDWSIAILLVDFAILALSKQEWWVILLCVSVLCAGFVLGGNCYEYLSKKKVEGQQECQQADAKN